MSIDLSADEAAFLDAGYEWIDENGETLIGLLEELVARPSYTGEEGTHDAPGTTVGHLWEFLRERTGNAVELEAQPIPAEAEPVPLEQVRENVYSVVEGKGEGGFLALSHTDIVPAGAHSAWPGDTPFDVSYGTARRTDWTEVELEIEGEIYRRNIRDKLARVWDKRETEEVDVLVGRGVYDNKACSVCLIGSLLGLEAALRETGVGLTGDVIHGHLVDEEKDEVGVKNMVGWRDNKHNEDWMGDRYDSFDDFTGVILEGQYGFVPVVGHRGGLNLTVKANGEAVHGSTPELGRNAVLGMSKALSQMDTQAFRDSIDEVFIDDRLLGDISVAPGTTIAGGGIDEIDSATGTVKREGGAEYAVSDWCEATVDCRVPRWEGFPDDPESVEEEFLLRVREHVDAAAPDIDFDVEANNFFFPIALGRDHEEAKEHPLVHTAEQATNDVFGYKAGIDVAPGGTDAWILYHGTHIPTLVEYGPAGALSHEPLEYVERQQVIDGAKALLNMTVRQTGLTS